MQKVLVLGGSGLVGKAIIEEMRKLNQYKIYASYFQNIIQIKGVEFFKFNVEEDLKSIHYLLEDINPELVISLLKRGF